MPVADVKLNGQVLWEGSPFTGFSLRHDGQQVSTLSTPLELEVEEAGPLRVVILVRGAHRTADGSPYLDLRGRITAYAGKPYIESEGSPREVPGGGYWGSYSKQDGLYDYTHIGQYTPEMKASQVALAREHLDRGEGYMLASTWLQCPPPGPYHRPGGDGSPEDPGIRWWLEWLRQEYGAYV